MTVRRPGDQDHELEEFYEYDEETGVLTWTDAWSKPSPVDGVCLGEYRRIMAAIERRRHLTPEEIFAENARHLEFARSYANATVDLSVAGNR